MIKFWNSDYKRGNIFLQKIPDPFYFTYYYATYLVKGEIHERKNNWCVIKQQYEKDLRSKQLPS